MNNIDLLKMQISDADYFKSMFYRNLVAGFYVQNENRLAQYKSALQKAKETLALISEELESENKKSRNCGI
jgi:hypothetical protein